MTARPVLVVVVVADAALRTELVRRLAMQGVELLSASGWTAALLASSTIPPQSVLVVDETARAHAARIERQCSEGQWRRVVAVAARARAANDHGWLPVAERCAPADLLSAVFANGTSAAAA